MPRELTDGLYDLLTTEETEQALQSSSLEAITEKLDPQTSHLRLTEALAEILSNLLVEFKDGESNDKILKQLGLVNSLLKEVRSIFKTESLPLLSSPPSVLKALHGRDLEPELPEIGLSQPWLFTAGKDTPPLLQELRAELRSCNRVDILVSFITVSGVRKIVDLLEDITSTDATGQSKTHLRIITTTYIGATEQKALDTLANLPNCSVKVSLDGRRTRLHAKAWIFERETGFGSAYVGSANLSGAALLGGLEWTVKFTEKGQRTLFHRAQAHFETLWNDVEFQTYDPANQTHRAALKNALRIESGRDFVSNQTFFDIQPKPFQQDILDQLENERFHGRTRNLLVAATGTGKTVMAALDYKRLAAKEKGSPRLLFIAHRTQLLEQALQTYRFVLKDSTFGDRLDGNHQPAQYNHLFTTIQSANARQLIGNFGADYWSIIVIDECHHIEANGFERLVLKAAPKYLLGLTATPERSDGRNILRHFENRPDGTPAAQLRLWHALDQQLLAPFEYYACDDSVDYRSVPWSQPGETAALDNLITGNTLRVRSIVNAWQRLVENPLEGRTLIFCVSIAHAEFMAQELTKAGIITRVVSSKSTQQERADIPRALEKGHIHAIATVDLYNEGVDLPFVDTLLLLRPTQSATVFQQQLGRGLRLFEGKDSCLVLDFVGQYSEGFRFDILYSSITGLSRRDVIEGVERGFGKLPSGCHIQLEKQARENILRSLRGVLNQNWRRLQTELQTYCSLHMIKNPKLSDFLYDQRLELEDIYRPKASSSTNNSGWTNLKKAAGVVKAEINEPAATFSRRLGGLIHLEDPDQIKLLKNIGESEGQLSIGADRDRTRILMLAYQIDGTRNTTTPEGFLDFVGHSPELCEELLELGSYLEAREQRVFRPLPEFANGLIKLHCAYNAREILTAIGFLTSEKRTPFQAGVLALKSEKTELLFVTLDKSSALHQGVAYEDYAISPNLFHWQSQNSSAPDTPTGKKYLESPKNGWRFELFVRKNKQSPYRACGPVVLESTHGERPMNIVWRLTNSLPTWLFQELSVLH